MYRRILWYPGVYDTIAISADFRRHLLNLATIISQDPDIQFFFMIKYVFVKIIEI